MNIVCILLFIPMRVITNKRLCNIIILGLQNHQTVLVMELKIAASLTRKGDVAQLFSEASLICEQVGTFYRCCKWSNYVLLKNNCLVKFIIIRQKMRCRNGSIIRNYTYVMDYMYILDEQQAQAKYP